MRVNNVHGLIVSTDEDPSLRIESTAMLNLRDFSTKLYFKRNFVYHFCLLHCKDQIN